MPLDPAVRRLIGALALAAPPADTGAAVRADVARRREGFRRLMRLAETDAHVSAVEQLAAPGPAGPVPLRLYIPARRCPGAGWPGLVYMHGGGFVCGDLDTHDPLCRALCRETGCAVVAIDYRLAPEHPYPAALQDAEAAACWVIDQAVALGLDPARVAISGDSAGANLAAVVCQSLAAARPGALALQLLLCPILDYSAVTNSRKTFAHGYLLDRDAMAQELACYLPIGHDRRHPRMSPLRAVDLRRLPPTHIHTAEFDPVRDEGRAYAERLRAAGIAVRYTCHVGMIHLFYGLGRMVPYARTALRDIGGDIRAVLA